MILLKFANLLGLTLGVAGLNGYTVPPGSPGYQLGNSTQAIQFDPQSLFIDGKRVFLFSGEFHPWRIPVPQLWSDILQKMKAAGLNAVSIYIHWGATEGKQGTLDWNYWRSIEQFYQVAEKVGIYVVARPGPYANAETSGGGLPGWLSNIQATARTNQTGYTDAWQSYVKQFSSITSKYQYPHGPVIAVQSENEFFPSRSGDPTATQYMTLLEAAFRANGITQVPLTHNDNGLHGYYASGPGQVDIYAFDAYPNGFNCKDPASWSEVPTNVAKFHSYAPYSLAWLGEFQGGSFDAWGGSGYDNCYSLVNDQFANVYYKNNLAGGAKAMSFYMFYGGTNWGNLAEPTVYTSYDYGAPIRETRLLTDKYSEIKLQGLFYQASPSLYSTTILKSATGAPYASSSSIFTTDLGTSTNATHFYVVRQTSNKVTTSTSFNLTVNTTVGMITVPQMGGSITLAGRESKTLVSEYPFGSSVVHYSTAEVMTQTTMDGKDYIVLYVLAGQSLEALIQGPTSAIPKVTGSTTITAAGRNSSVIITGSPKGVSVVQLGSTVVIVADKATAKTFWQTHTTQVFDQGPSVPSVLVTGPYLVRNATVTSSTLNLVGDTNGTTPLTVFAPSSVKAVTWNGAAVSVSASALGIGLTGLIDGAASGLTLPQLKSLPWKSADSLPEIATGFDDSSWATANKTSTSRPIKPSAGKYMLYADEYGFHGGNFVYRGYFNGKATGVALNVTGGSASSFSAFLNGQFLASGQASLTFPASVVTSGRNVLTVISDSSGLDEDYEGTDTFKSPRGIQGYTLQGGGDFDTWKIAGTLGGESYPDKVRGPYNEGGLWAERVGAHLPGYNDANWTSSTPYVGITHAGVQVYRTTFNLKFTPGVDVPVALQFTATKTSSYRCLIFVNGWQFGRFISNVGPQTVYPIPEGILNYNGDNTLTVTLWSLDGTGAKVADLELISFTAVRSGREAVTGPVLSPGYSDLR